MKRKMMILTSLAIAVAIFIVSFIYNEQFKMIEWCAINGWIKSMPKNDLDAFNAPTSDSMPRLSINAIKYKGDPFVSSRERQDSPFEFRGGAGIGRVVDRRGRIILESSKEIGIFGVSVSPDKKKILVRGGDSGTIVMDPLTGRKIRLPSYPPEPEVLFIGDWRWIGPDSVFGSSGIQAFDDKGAPIKCCEGHNIARTKFYVYDIIAGVLSEVVTTDVVKETLVNAVEVVSDGYIHLLDEKSGRDLGWFKVNVSK